MTNTVITNFIKHSVCFRLRSKHLKYISAFFFTDTETETPHFTDMPTKTQVN